MDGGGCRIDTISQNIPFMRRRTRRVNFGALRLAMAVPRFSFAVIAITTACTLTSCIVRWMIEMGSGRNSSRGPSSRFRFIRLAVILYRVLVGLLGMRRISWMGRSASSGVVVGMLVGGRLVLRRWMPIH